MSNETRQAGTMSQRAIDLLNRNDVDPGTPILVGNTNIEHMKKQHPSDYEKYGDYLDDILASPTYVANHPSNDSVQYIKVFEECDEHILIAIRITQKGNLFARTLFVMSEVKVKQYKNSGALKNY